MIKVGITGGIGSGKSTVAKIFEVLGIPVYYADVRAKELMEEDEELIQQLKDIFGEEIYTSGILERQKLSEIVFKDKEKLAQLNAAVHPAVFKDVQDWMNTHKDIPYTLKEAALIFESGSYKELDKVITVYAEKEVRMARIIERDKTGRAAVEARIANQLSEEEKMQRSDFIIYNNEKELLIPQVLHIHEQLLVAAGHTL